MATAAPTREEAMNAGANATMVPDILQELHRLSFSGARLCSAARPVASCLSAGPEASGAPAHAGKREVVKVKGTPAMKKHPPPASRTRIRQHQR
jgi:hypothetical protein